MYNKKAIYFIVVFLSFCACVGGHRVARHVNDSANPGWCESFLLGGSSGLHFYTCCNNCNEQHASCDGRTYQSASNGRYCDTCGRDNAQGNGITYHNFTCGGCAGQAMIKARCLEGFFDVLDNIPGFCWVFTWCFKAKCKDQFPQRLGSQVMSSNATSYDLQCNNGETVEDSPVDCCQTVNDQCKFVDGQCPPLCCSEPDCCSTSTGTSTESASGAIIGWMSVFLALETLL